MSRRRIAALLLAVGLVGPLVIIGIEGRTAGATGQLPIEIEPITDPILDGLVAAGLPADAATRGVWSEAMSWPLLAIHNAVMPDGTVVSYGSPLGVDGQNGNVFDVWVPELGAGPASHTDVPNVAGYDSFCSLAALLPTGELVVASGNTARAVTVYDSSRRTARPSSPLNSDRWYATMTILPDGRPLVTGGGVPYAAGDKRDDPAYPDFSDDLDWQLDASLNDNVFITPEVLDAAGNWRLLGGATSRDAFGPDYNRWWYPRQWVAPNGRVFGISSDKMWYLDPAGNGSISVVGNFKTPAVVGAPADGTAPNVGPTSTAVMFDTGKILQVGGNGYYNDYPSNSSARATVIDITGGAPVLRETRSMRAARQWANSTVLPTGEVLVNGGTRFANATDRAVKPAELWDPQTGAWTAMAAESIERLYHSSAVLLPNGAVLSSGGGAPVGQPSTPGAPIGVPQRNAQVFYPPALFVPKTGGGSVLADRPVIDRISAEQVAHGQPIELALDDDRTISEVSLIGLSSTTHALNMGQRRMTVPFTQSGERVSFGAPGSANVAPPGFYLLTVIDGGGVPSHSVIVGIGTTAPASPPTTVPTTTRSVPTPVVDPTVPPGGGSAGDPAEYVAVVPDRVLDTRTGTKPAPGHTITVDVTRRSTSQLPDNATAVVLNITGTEPTNNGYLTIWPCGTPMPTASNLNLTTGTTTPNAVISKIGTNGTICIYTNAGTHLIADINGYMPATSTYTGVIPDRVLDTRTGTKPAPGHTITVDVTRRSTSQLPDNATAVVLNITGTEPTNNGYLTIWPCGTPMPTASNLNLTTGTTTPNAVISKIGTNGTICIYINAGTHLIADINGYMPATSTYTGVIPDRVLDTRTGTKPAPGHTITVDVTRRSTSQLPDNATAVVLNITGTEPTNNGYLTIWPCGTPMPTASNLNLTTGTTTPNAVISKIGTNGTICIYTNAGTHLIADINGYWPVPGVG